MIIYKEKNGERVFLIEDGYAIELEPIIHKAEPANLSEIKPYKSSKIKPRSKYENRPDGGMSEKQTNHRDILEDAKVELVGGDTTKPWARKFERCIDCGTTEKKHQSAGRCFTCYQNNRKTTAGVAAEKRREKHGQTKEWRCTDCYHEFESDLDKLDIYCLKCGDVHCVQV